MSGFNSGVTTYSILQVSGSACSVFHYLPIHMEEECNLVQSILTISNTGRADRNR